MIFYLSFVYFVVFFSLHISLYWWHIFCFIWKPFMRMNIPNELACVSVGYSNLNLLLYYEFNTNIWSIHFQIKQRKSKNKYMRLKWGKWTIGFWSWLRARRCSKAKKKQVYCENLKLLSECQNLHERLISMIIHANCCYIRKSR